MSAEYDFCVGQIARCSGLNFWAGLDKAAKVELTKTLSECSHSNTHAERIIGAWLRENSDRPTANQIRHMAYSVGDGSALPPACSKCNGDYHVPGESQEWQGQTVTSFRRCTCLRGLYYAERDRINELERKERIGL